MSIIPKAKKNLNSLTVLEREKEKKRIRAESEELLEEMGQTSDKKALRTVQKYVKEQEEVDRKQQEEDIESLKTLSTNKKNYQRYLIVVLHRFVEEEKLPKTYQLYVDSTDQGIVLGISNTIYLRAFRVSGMPKYDINACKILAVQLGNTIARLQGKFRQTDGGILLANKEEMELVKRQANKKYGRR